MTAALTTQVAGSGDELPSDIQYMPPGRHRIAATRGGKPLELEVTVDAETAARLEAFFARAIGKGGGGGGRPSVF